MLSPGLDGAYVERHRHHVVCEAPDPGARSQKASGLGELVGGCGERSLHEKHERLECPQRHEVGSAPPERTEDRLGSLVSDRERFQIFLVTDERWNRPGVSR